METAPTIHLPIEVWENVFQHSVAKDAWNFRLVCKAWRKELDDRFGKWVVRVDQHSHYFQHALQLKVKEARILNLSNPVDVGQGGTPRLFKHPELLEKVSIPQDSYIRPANLVLLLNSCAKTIKHLDIEVGVHGVLSDVSYNLHPNGFGFPKLESLYLNLHSCPRRTIQQLPLFKLMIGLSTMAKIKSLTVAIRNQCSNFVSSTVLEFIGKNGSNLEVIDCHFAEDRDQLQAQPIDLVLLKRVVRLKILKIQYDCHPSELPWGFVEGWSTLLKAQMNLVVLNLRSLPIIPEILRLVCHNNEHSLTKIELGYLDFDIDLEILAGCVHLNELHFFTHYEEDEEDMPVLRNARNLPVGIQKFRCGDYLIESADILDFFVGHGELLEIRLNACGSEGLYGVTAAVFAHFVANRELSDKLGGIHISGFNCSTAEDLTALKEIVRSLEHQALHDVDKEDLREVGIRFDRTRGEDGDWSTWRIRIQEPY